MGRKLENLDNISYCLCCGESKNTTNLNMDHFIPRALLSRPRIPLTEEEYDTLGIRSRPLLEIDENPFFSVVHQGYNRFTLCYDDHRRIDNRKIAAFCGNSIETANSIALWEMLFDYPITDNPRFFDLQKFSLTWTAASYKEAAKHLNGEFREWAAGFKQSVPLVEDFIKKIGALTITYKRTFLT